MDSDTSDEISFSELANIIFEELKPFKLSFLLSVFLGLIGTLSWLYPPWAIGEITTFFSEYGGGDIDYVYLLLGIWLMFSIIRFASREISKYIGFQIAEGIGLTTRIKTISHLFNLDLMWHENDYAGAKMKRMTNGASGITEIIRIIITHILEATVVLVGVFFIISTLSKKISLVLGFFIVTYYILSFKLSRRASQQSLVVHKQEEAVDGISYESIVNISTVKNLDLSESLLTTINLSMEPLMFEIKKRIQYFRTREFILSLYGNTFQLIGILMVADGIKSGDLKTGDLVMFFAYFQRIWGATAEMASVTDRLLIKKVAVGRLNSILKVKPTIDVEGKNTMPKDWKKIELCNVSFSYGGEKVLDNVSFDIVRGMKVGLVGPSGSGKTTLFKLLLNLHHGYDGEILVDGIPLKNIDRKSYLEEVSVVLQDTEVFNMSLHANLMLASNNGGDIWQALDAANLKEMVDSLPKGADTVIGEKGVRLSGGEKQRLGIARAIYRRPQLLYMDEATSNLDSDSELKIQTALEKLFESVTAVVIAHRLSTIRKMDKILVLDSGKLVESGTFNELINQKGLFHELWEKQKL